MTAAPTATRVTPVASTWGRFSASMPPIAKAGEVAAQLVEEGNSACKLDPFMPYFPLPRDFPLKVIRHAARIFRC